VRILTKRFEAWPAEVRRQLIRATLPDGSMRFCVRKKPGTQTFVAFNGKRVMGWLILWPTTAGTFATAFVYKRYRGQKVARKLYERAIRSERPLHALVWDDASRRLFESVRAAHPGQFIIHEWMPFREKHGQLQEIGID